VTEWIFRLTYCKLYLFLCVVCVLFRVDARNNLLPEREFSLVCGSGLISRMLTKLALKHAVGRSDNVEVKWIGSV
jgi:hypothetical protein